MVSMRASIEMIAPTVEEAIEKGLAEMGLSRQSVDIDILDEGSRGIFGIGIRQARVRITQKSADTEAIESATPMEMEITTPQVDQTAPAKPIVPVKEGEENLELQITRETVEELLSLMKVKARVSTSFGDADDLTGKTPVLVDIHGDDLSILIGKRSETLNALQYITRLIVGKILGYALVISIDVEGFRSRREKQLRQLARRMADQAVKTGRKQVLEPMPANERRIVHIELREHAQVRTESQGEEPYRKVTIVPR